MTRITEYLKCFQCFSKDWTKMCTKNNTLKLLINISLTRKCLRYEVFNIKSDASWRFNTLQVDPSRVGKDIHSKSRQFKDLIINQVQQINISKDQYIARSVDHEFTKFSFQKLNLFGISFHLLNHSFFLIFLFPVFIFSCK